MGQTTHWESFKNLAGGEFCFTSFACGTFRFIKIWPAAQFSHKTSFP